MKTLIYDNECPLCTAYTGAFVKTGLLQKEGRKNFNQVSPELFRLVNKEKANDEIPLVDSKSGQVWYGIDALLELLGNKFPFIKTIGQTKPLHWFLQKLYKLISYNRKVIVAVKTVGYDCSPAFNIRYRVLFLVIGLVFNSFLFTASIPFFSKHIFTGAENLQALHFFLVGINIAIGIMLGFKKGLEYLGQINMLALISMLCLWPFSLLQQYLPTGICIFFVGMLSCYIAREYIRRMDFISILKTNKLVVAANILSCAAALIYLSKI